MHLNIAHVDASNEELRDAVHEAGHAVAHSVLKRPFSRVTLADRHGPARIEFEPTGELTEDEWEQEVICALAGVVAEARIVGGRSPMEIVLSGWGDQAAVRDMLGPRARDKQLIERLLNRTLNLVVSNRNAIKRVAKALLRRDELSDDEVAVAGAPFVLLA